MASKYLREWLVVNKTVVFLYKEMVVAVKKIRFVFLIDDPKSR